MNYDLNILENMKLVTSKVNNPTKNNSLNPWEKRYFDITLNTRISRIRGRKWQLHKFRARLKGAKLPSLDYTARVTQQTRTSNIRNKSIFLYKSLLRVYMQRMSRLTSTGLEFLKQLKNRSLDIGELLSTIQSRGHC